MEPKKNPKIDGKQFRPMFRNMGFIVAFSLTITAFEWKFEDVKIDVKIPVDDPIAVVYTVPTEQELPPEPKIEKIKSPVESSTFIEVDDLDELVDKITKPVVEKKVEKQIVTIIEEEEEEKIEIPVFVAEKDAEPEVGMQKWKKKMAKYCAKNYPERDRRAGVEGKVYVSFVIEKDGSITDLKVMKGLSKTLDKVAMDAVRKNGKWKAARQGGRKVRLMKRLPINFNI